MTTLSLRFTFTPPEFSDVAFGETAFGENPISRYRVRYKPITFHKRAEQLSGSAEVFEAEPQIIGSPPVHVVTLSSATIYPATTYQCLGFSARNLLNAQFGPEVEPLSLTIRTPDPTSVFFFTPNPLGFAFTPRFKTFWRGEVFTTNYYSENEAILHEGTMTFFVNGGRMGENAMASLKSYYKTSGPYELIEEITFDGTEISRAASSEFTGFQLSVSAVDPKAAVPALKTMAIVGSCQPAISEIPGAGMFPVHATNVYGLKLELEGIGSLVNINSSIPQSIYYEYEFVVDDLVGVPYTNGSGTDPNPPNYATAISDMTFVRLNNIPSLQTFTLTTSFIVSNLCSETTKFVRPDLQYAITSFEALGRFTSPNSLTKVHYFEPDSISSSMHVFHKVQSCRLSMNTGWMDGAASFLDTRIQLLNLNGEKKMDLQNPPDYETQWFFDGDAWEDDLRTTIKPFGSQSYVWGESRYEVRPISHTESILDSQLLYFRNRYTADAYFFKDYSSFSGGGPDYSGFVETGTPLLKGTQTHNYKWIIFKFSQTCFVNAVSDTQQKRLLVNGADLSEWHEDLEVFFMQTGSAFSTMWLNARKTFVEYELPLFTSRTIAAALTDDAALGNHNQERPGYFVFRTGSSHTVFDFYVRVGLRVRNPSPNPASMYEIESVLLE